MQDFAKRRIKQERSDAVFFWVETITICLGIFLVGVCAFIGAGHLLVALILK